MVTLQSAERLTIARARSIVEQAEAAFERGQPIFDAFDPFSEAGAIDRQEAYTALLLVIADYFAVAGHFDKAEREKYDRYVKLSRSIATRVVCDGVEHTETAIDFMLDCGPSFDRFTQWLSLQDSSKDTFWPFVYRRLGIDPASAPVLQSSTIQALDMDQLTELIGCVYQPPSDKAALRESGFDLQSGSSNSQYLSCKRRGISVLLEESVVSAVFLYKENSDGYATFPCRLTGDITFGSRRSRVRAALGQPDRTHGNSYVYNCGRYSVNFEFREWLGTLKLVVIQSESRPDA